MKLRLPRLSITVQHLNSILIYNPAFFYARQKASTPYTQTCTGRHLLIGGKTHSLCPWALLQRWPVQLSHLQQLTFYVCLLSVNVFKIHSCCIMHQYFIPLQGSIIFHVCLYCTFFIHSFVNGHQGCFYFLVIVNGAAVNIHVRAVV